MNHRCGARVTVVVSLLTPHVAVYVTSVARVWCEDSMDVVVSDITDHGERKSRLSMGNGDNKRCVTEKSWMDG